jgi:hypothetical protein
MLTEEQQRNGMINTTYRWLNRVVPYVIDGIFSEYCSTMLQIATGAWRVVSLEYEYRISSSTQWRVNGKMKTIVTNVCH